MSLVNSHSPKTNQTFSFSDNEYGGSADNSDDDENDNSVIKGKSKIVFVYLYSLIIGEPIVAFCSFFPCSLTVFHRGRQQKSGGRQ